MNVETNTRFAETGKPGVRAFNHIAMLSGPLLAFYTETGDTICDTALLQITPTAGKVIACNLAWHLQGWPSSVGLNAIKSCRLAPVTVMASGTPRAFTTMCCFDLDFPQWVGAGFLAPGAGHTSAMRCPFWLQLCDDLLSRSLYNDWLGDGIPPLTAAICG